MWLKMRMSQSTSALRQSLSSAWLAGTHAIGMVPGGTIVAASRWVPSRRLQSVLCVSGRVGTMREERLRSSRRLPEI